MLSFRDIATSADNDADSLQTSLRELQRRRQAKQQRQQHEREAVFTEDDPHEAFTAVQELAYSREVLHAWSRSYPKLRDAMASLALASRRNSLSHMKEEPLDVRRARVHQAYSPNEERGSAAAAAAAVAGASPSDQLIFSVADTVKRSYPPVWVIPAGTVPPSYYSDTAAMEDSLQLSSASSSPQRQLLASTSVYHSNGQNNNNNINSSSNGASVLYAASSQFYQLNPGRLGPATGGHAAWVTDYSYRRCLVQIRREALQLTAAAGAGDATSLSVSATPLSSALAGFTPPPSASTTSLSTVHYAQHQPPPPPQQQQKQRVLARWPQGKPASTKVSAVLRSIDIETRKREQWNEHVRKQQQQQQQTKMTNTNEENTDDPSINHRNLNEDSTRELVSQASLTSYSVTNTAAAAGLKKGGNVNRNESRRRSLPGASEDAWGKELYWPAYITNTRAIFTGAPCLHDDYHGLGLLQLYERFDTVLALALASPLQLVVDVVYAIDETSEGFGLSIDPIVTTVADGTAALSKTAAFRGGNEIGTSTEEEEEGKGVEDGEEGPSAFRSLFPHTTALRSPRRPSADLATTSTQEQKESCHPLLLPSTLPAVLSDFNYSFQPAPPQPASTAASSAATSTTAAEARRRGNRPAATAPADPANTTTTSRGDNTLWESEDAQLEPPAATLRRSTLSTAPLSAYTILAGPVSQSRSIVFLRPTPEVVCAARARALHELEVRWQRLRQALIDRLVAYEEEPPHPVSAAESDGEDEEERRGVSSVEEEEEEKEREAPSAGVSLVQLPDVDSYVSPFIDLSTAKDEGLPEEPAGAVALTEEEMRRQTRLPELQGSRRRRRPSWPLACSSTPTPQPARRVSDGGAGEDTQGFPFVPSRATSPQPTGSTTHRPKHNEAQLQEDGQKGTSRPTSARAREHSLLSTSSTEDAAAVIAAASAGPTGAAPTAAAATTRSLSSTSSSLRGRLPLRRRSAHDPLNSVDLADTSSGTAGTGRSQPPQQQQQQSQNQQTQQQQQPYTPRLVAYTQQAPSKRSTGLFSDESSSVDFSVTSSVARHRDEVSAPTQQPRSLADPLPAHVDLTASSVHGTNTSELSVEESRALSAAVRAAAARQKALEEAIRNQRRPAAAPRHALPPLTVEAPSRASAEPSTSPSRSRKEARPPHERANSMDITNNASAIFPSPIRAMTPPSSALSAALRDTTKDFSPFSWDTVEKSSARQEKHTGTQQKEQNNNNNDKNRQDKNPDSSMYSNDNSPQRSNRGGLQPRSTSSSPSRVGGMGINDSSSLQFTPPAAHLLPRPRFNERGELIIPSLSTTPLTKQSTGAGELSRGGEEVTQRSTAVPTATAAASTAAMSPPRNTAAASFSTPPPPAPPSHSSSPPPRDAVVQHTTRTQPNKASASTSAQPPHHVSFLAQNHQPSGTSGKGKAPALLNGASREAGVAAVQKDATARQLLTPSLTHPESGSNSGSNSSSVDGADTEEKGDTRIRFTVEAAAAAPTAKTTARAAPDFAPLATSGSSQGHRSSTQPPAERFSRTNTTHLPAALGGSGTNSPPPSPAPAGAGAAVEKKLAGKLKEKVVGARHDDTTVATTGVAAAAAATASDASQGSLASSSSISGSDVPQLRNTTAYANPATSSMSARSKQDTAVPPTATKQHLETTTPSPKVAATTTTAAAQPAGVAAAPSARAHKGAHRDAAVTVEPPATAAAEAAVIPAMHLSARRASAELSASPASFVRPSFSPGPSSARSSPNSGSLRDQQQLQLRHVQPRYAAPQVSDNEPARPVARKKGVLQSPRSLAASAAAAALAKTMAEAAAQAAAQAAAAAELYPSPSPTRVRELDAQRSVNHLVSVKDGSTYYNRGYAVVDVLIDVEKDPLEVVAQQQQHEQPQPQQDSPLPRRPSLHNHATGKSDGTVPVLAQVPAARVPANSPSLQAATGDATVAPVPSQRQLKKRDGQAFPSDGSGSGSASDTGVVYSSSVNREVELPSSSCSRRVHSPKDTRKQQQQQQQQTPSPPPLAMPHRQPHAAASLQNLGALDDAELVRLYEFLYRHNNTVSDSKNNHKTNEVEVTAPAEEHAAQNKTEAEGPRDSREKMTREGRGKDDTEFYTPHSETEKVSTHPEQHAASQLSEPASSRDAVGPQAATAYRIQRDASRVSEVDEERVKSLLTQQQQQQQREQPHSHRAAPSPASRTQSSHRSHRHHKSHPNGLEKLPSSTSRTTSPQTTVSHRHRSRHRSRHHHRPHRTVSNDSRKSHSSAESDAGRRTLNPTAPTKVPPLRLHELTPPPTKPGAPLGASEVPFNREEVVREVEQTDARHAQEAAVQRRRSQREIVAQLVSPSSSASASPAQSSRAHSQDSSLASSKYIAGPPSPPAHRHHRSEDPHFGIHPEQHHDPSPQPLARRSAQPSPQRTVLVRRVVRRRRSDVFVEEGGSLVYRAPVALHGPLHSRSSSPASSQAPSRAWSAGKAREREHK